REDDRMHTDYSLLRFVVAVTPILGFLGTVVHFGTALSGMSFDEMTERLPAVVAEMGMAFNTTTVALAAAMTAMCMMFICERVERGILQTVDRFIEREVVTRFEVKEQQIEPFLAVIQSVHEAALGGIATTLERQFEVWNSKIDGLFSRFDSHQDNATAAWQAALSNLQEQHEQYSLSREDHVIESLGLIDAAGGRHLAMIQEILERVSEFRGELTGLTNTLEIIARGEGKLVDLQSTLSDNIHALRQSGQIDEALHGLTAAIHLMTVRHHPVKLQDAA
ncbi:MAG: MotA/TolQ/ExbB proton channel family protein, partial [Planctomycetota bacterium]